MVSTVSPTGNIQVKPVQGGRNSLYRLV